MRGAWGEKRQQQQWCRTCAGRAGTYGWVVGTGRAGLLDKHLEAEGNIGMAHVCLHVVHVCLRVVHVCLRVVHVCLRVVHVCLHVVHVGVHATCTCCTCVFTSPIVSGNSSLCSTLCLLSQN